MVNESTSGNIVLQGYISNTNLTNFDFDNTSETIFNSLSALRSTIYSTAIEAVTNGVKNPSFIRIAGGVLADSPLTAIGIAIRVNDEGLLQATVTGLLTSGLTTTVGVLVIAPAIAGAGLSTAAALGVGVIATGITGLVIDKLTDGIYDFAEKKISDYKYNENNKSLELTTNLDNINDIKTLVEPTILFGSVEESQYINDIIINQEVGDQTNTYTVKTGDTMWDIANRFGTTQEELIEVNPWLSDRYSEDKSFALIRPDEQIIIPKGSIKGTDNTKINQDFNNFLNGNFSKPDTPAPEGVTLPSSGKTGNTTVEHYTSKPQMMSQNDIFLRALKEGNIEALKKVIPNADKK